MYLIKVDFPEPAFPLIQYIPSPCRNQCAKFVEGRQVFAMLPEAPAVSGSLNIQENVVLCASWISSRRSSIVANLRLFNIAKLASSSSWRCLLIYSSSSEAKLCFCIVSSSILCAASSFLSSPFASATTFRSVFRKLSMLCCWLESSNLNFVSIVSLIMGSSIERTCSFSLHANNLVSNHGKL